MTGIVTAEHEAILDLIVSGPAGEPQVIEALVDTGYNGFLCLPPEVITRLALPWKRQSQVELADGSISPCEVHEGFVFWDDRLIRISIDSTPSIPLVGMKLLDGYRLRIDVREGGLVVIEPLAG